MKTVTSKDGTIIAFEQTGKGPALILVVGAFNDRMTGMPLTRMLEAHFTVINYDRRGRGDSGDTLPYSVEREIEDLEALIGEVGGSAYVFGYSSGAVLALKAVGNGLAISKLILYEPPLFTETSSAEGVGSVGHLSSADGREIEVSNSHSTPPVKLAHELDQLVKADQRGEAVELFQTKGVGIPQEVVVQMRNAPFRPMLETMAHTLVYEMTIIGEVSSQPTFLQSLNTPTLVIAGGKSPTFLQSAARSLAAALPEGEYRILEGQTHDIVPEAVAPVLTEYLLSETVG